jgi:23S rRNA (adenine2503-C2)-methyltransferase
METPVTSIFEFTLHELEAQCSRLGVPRVHAKNLFRGLYKSSVTTPWQSDGMPLRLRGMFCSNPDIPTIASTHESNYDGSVKFLVKYSDNSLVEMVLMPEKKRITLCLSSQVGCAQGCTFCHTGRMGLKRNLSASEIVQQLWLANKWIQENLPWLAKQNLPSLQRISNIVFMGMGEPLDNVEHVAQAIKIFTDPYGPNIALRRISVSTAGHLEGLKKIVGIIPDVRLAISIHSPDDKERSRIMPINRRWPLETLIETLRDMPTQKQHGILLQYTLIDKVNDSIGHAQKLIHLVQGLNVKINLIPLNPVGPSRFGSPEFDRIQAFKDEIYRAGIRVLVRYSKGQDIAAACGQLVVNSGT